jgi:hypothetical protein
MSVFEWMRRVRYRMMCDGCGGLQRSREGEEVEVDKSKDNSKASQRSRKLIKTRTKTTTES